MIAKIGQTRSVEPLVGHGMGMNLCERKHGTPGTSYRYFRFRTDGGWEMAGDAVFGAPEIVNCDASMRSCVGPNRSIGVSDEECWLKSKRNLATSI